MSRSRIYEKYLIAIIQQSCTNRGKTPPPKLPPHSSKHPTLQNHEATKTNSLCINSSLMQLLIIVLRQIQNNLFELCYRIIHCCTRTRNQRLNNFLVHWLCKNGKEVLQVMETMKSTDCSLMAEERFIGRGRP